MHRLRPRLAAHAPSRFYEAARAIDRRGVIATYELHDRVLENRRSRRHYAEAPPVLDDLQRHLVDELDREGNIVLPFTDLVGADEWAAIDAQARAFVESTERALADGGAQLKVRAGKEFVVRAHSFEGVTLGLDDAWFRACTSQRLLDVANAYLRMWAKLSYVDLWYTAPQREGTERAASQLWHLDFDDKHLLKAFLYLSDVDEGAGPFEYVAGSQAGGRYEDTWAWAPLGTKRISEEDVLGRVDAGAIRTFTASRGTLILCNTSGLHRGGFATTSPRVLATATYCSPASLASLSQRNYAVETETHGALNPVGRYAVN
jgi:hypothetical protein